MNELIDALRCRSNDIRQCERCAFKDACYGGTLELIAADALERMTAQLPVWISVEERLPEAHRPVWTAIYTTDLIFVQDGETIEEAAERTQAEAEKHPRCEMGAVDEGGFWYELTFGAPMVCRPSFWMEPPKAPEVNK